MLIRKCLEISRLVMPKTRNLHAGQLLFMQVARFQKLSVLLSY